MRFIKQSKMMTQLTFINLHPNEYSQEFHYYPSAVKLDICICVGRCNTLTDLSSKVFVPNKMEDSILIVFNTITGTNGSKKLTKHISCNVNVDLMEENINQINGGVMIKVHAGVKNNINVKRIMFKPVTCSCENGKYLASIMDDSAIMCDEVIESYDEGTKTSLTNFSERI